MVVTIPTDFPGQDRDTAKLGIKPFSFKYTVSTHKEEFLFGSIDSKRQTTDDNGTLNMQIGCLQCLFKNFLETDCSG